MKKCDAESELEHENHERGILKLAFLMQIRNKVRPAQFFAFGSASAERNENRKIQVHGRFGGMCGGAGGRFEGG